MSGRHQALREGVFCSMESFKMPALLTLAAIRITLVADLRANRMLLLKVLVSGKRVRFFIPSCLFLILSGPFSFGLQAEASVLPVGTIVPKPSTPETFSQKPTPLLFRVVNRGKKGLYIQGMQQGEERMVQLFFYHKTRETGWKPFFNSLPCDLPTCRNLHARNKTCGKPHPFAIHLEPLGSAKSAREFQWDGLLYQRIEATGERRKRRYCYKGWIPKRGRIRVEVEYSSSIQRGLKKRGQIGERNHTAIEFSLPPLKKTYEISIGRDSP